MNKYLSKSIIFTSPLAGFVRLLQGMNTASPGDSGATRKTISHMKSRLLVAWDPLTPGNKTEGKIFWRWSPPDRGSRFGTKWHFRSKRKREPLLLISPDTFLIKTLPRLFIHSKPREEFFELGVKKQNNGFPTFCLALNYTSKIHLYEPQVFVFIIICSTMIKRTDISGINRGQKKFESLIWMYPLYIACWKINTGRYVCQ